MFSDGIFWDICGNVDSEGFLINYTLNQQNLGIIKERADCRNSRVQKLIINEAAGA